MNDKVYMHSLTSDSSNFDSQIKTLFNIAKSGYILSLRNQGKTESTGFAGLDYISMCDYEKRNLTPDIKERYNAYFMYVRYGITLAFDKSDIDVVIPEFFEIKSNRKENYDLMKRMGNSDKRYSDFLDEVQIKDKISLDKLSYITFPTKTFFETEFALTKNGRFNLLMSRIKSIKSIMEYFNYNTDIYDIDSKMLMDENGVRKLIYKK